MVEKNKTREELLAENEELKIRLIECEETLNAIQNGEVDAVLVDTPKGAQTFTLKGADYIYRVLIEEMNQGVAILTPDYTIYYCNSQLASMSKIPLEKMFGKNITEFIPEFEYNKLSKKCTIESCKEELSLRAIDGTVLPIELSAQLLEDIDSIYMIITDLSYYKQTEKKLNKLVENLRDSNDELRQFAYITSHDLQEPLRTMGSYAGLLKRRYEGKLDKDADEFIEYMVSAAIRMQQMIQGLLDYSRIGTKGQFKEFNAEESLTDALSNLKSSINEFDGEVTYDSFPVIFADPDQITSVFQNLIGNALKFRKEGVPPRIHISATKDENNDEYVFSVSDNGIGMEEQYTDKIFEVFKRLHAIGEYSGAGIGLAIVNKMIHNYGGRVWVKSKLGVGSTFYFTIPFQH
ncbi:ATP-binding protein [Methanobacterium oryzae]|uniref:PAS domain-containing sensor histidine kinase n=1 Tax=Methanobacterium oryzae TaxID=69540 RepID=UPI003D20C352